MLRKKALRTGLDRVVSIRTETDRNPYQRKGSSNDDQVANTRIRRHNGANNRNRATFSNPSTRADAESIT
jgi:hypothetical protein